MSTSGSHGPLTARAIHTALATVALAIVAAACAASAAHAQETVAAIRPSFSPDRLGARTAVTFGIHFAGGEEGVPAPVRKAVVQVPAGLGVELPSTLGCTVAHLQAHGASGCPPRSQIGSGHALMAVRTGAQVTREAATLWAFLGPLEGGQPTIQILGQGYTPIERRVAFSLRLEPDRAPFWAKLVALVPPIPTIPLEPDASAVNFSLTIGTTGRSRKPGTIGIFVPSHCPAGGFPWAAEFTYADGSTDNTTATIPCP